MPGAGRPGPGRSAPRPAQVGPEGADQQGRRHAEHELEVAHRISSVPGAGAAPGGPKRSARCGLTRLRSPRRIVSPALSKNSRIWIATLRPFSTRSRNWAAVNSPPGRVRDRSAHDPGHLGDGGAGEEVVVRHLVDAPRAADQPADPPDLGLGHLEQARDVAHARGAEPVVVAAEVGGDAAPQQLVGGAEPGHVAGPAHPGPLRRDGARRHEPRQRRDEDGAGQAGLQLQAQPLRAQALEVRVLGMEGVERPGQGVGIGGPAPRRQGRDAVPDPQGDEVEPARQGVGGLGGEGPGRGRSPTGRA